MGDERLILMAALMVTDELFDARADVDELLDGTDELRLLSGTAGHAAQSPGLKPAFAAGKLERFIRKIPLQQAERCQGPGFFAAPTLILPVLRGPSGAYDPGAYKIRTGAVTVRSRGFGHTVPTYTRRDHAGS